MQTSILDAQELALAGGFRGGTILTHDYTFREAAKVGKWKALRHFQQNCQLMKAWTHIRE